MQSIVGAGRAQRAEEAGKAGYVCALRGDACALTAVG